MTQYHRHVRNFEQHVENVSYPLLGALAVCTGAAVTALFPSTLPALKAADLLQDRQAAGRALAAVA